jgi:diketogulonate reductase-like aldo/keto reductase
MPTLGLGVLGRENRELTGHSVKAAIDVGYQLIDTAAAYNNERDVGEGLRMSGVHRSDVFVTTKLWMTEYGYEKALLAFSASLRKLGLDYVDLYLLHWPVPSNFEATIASYRAAEQLLADGRVRAIGVSNFSSANLQSLIAESSTTPMVNQVELHPFFQQRELRETHDRLGIVTQSWSPLGGSVRRSTATDQADPLTHPTIVGLATKYGKTPAQVIIRWHLDHGFSAIPKSFHPERIAENFDVFDFSLTEDDLAAMDDLDTEERSGPNPDVVHAKSFPITLED